MLNIENFFNSNSFLFIQNPTSKKMVFERICNKVFAIHKINKDLLLHNLIKREKIGTTTIGNGIAIPHVQNREITKPLCIITVLSKGLDFDALDNNPVDLIVFLILPESNKSGNLQILAQVSRILRNIDMTTKLRGCKSEESAYAIISQYLKNKAA